MVRSVIFRKLYRLSKVVIFTKSLASQFILIFKLQTLCQKLAIDVKLQLYQNQASALRHFKIVELQNPQKFSSSCTVLFLFKSCEILL